MMTRDKGKGSGVWHNTLPRILTNKVLQTRHLNLNCLYLGRIQFKMLGE
jgi:hypothetical protein